MNTKSYIIVVPRNCRIIVIPRLSVKAKRTICEVLAIAFAIACAVFGAALAYDKMPVGVCIAGMVPAAAVSVGWLIKAGAV